MPKQVRLVFLSLFLLALFFKVASAATCGTAPPGSSYCSPLTLTPTAGGVVSANTQTLITINTTSIGSAYLSSTLQNIEVYNITSGSTANCRIESYNSLNMMAINGLSDNALILCKIPDTYSSPDTHWAIAYQAPSNNLFSATGPWGLAPQIYGTGGACASYACYDNGQLVYNNYTNFEGTSAPTNWIIGSGGDGGGYAIIDNGITVGGTSLALGYGYAVSNWITSNQTEDVFVTNVISTGSGQNGDFPDGEFPIITSSTSNTFTEVASANVVGWNPYGNLWELKTLSWTNFYTGVTLGYFSADSSNPTSVNSTISIQGNYIEANYSEIYSYLYPNSSSELSGNYVALIGSGLHNGPSQVPGSLSVSWVGMRNIPPGNVMMSVTVAIPQSLYTAPTTPTLSAPSNAVADVGQSECFTGSVSGGTTPYTYNFLVSRVSVPSTLDYSGQISTSSTSATKCYQMQSYSVGDSPLEANVVVTDSNPTTVNSVYSGTFTVNYALASLSAGSSSTIDSGQSASLASTWSGGTSAFTVTLFSGASSTCSSDNTEVQQISTALGHYTFDVSPSSSTYYCIGVTDSASTPTSANQVTATMVTVNTALATPTITPSSAQHYDSGQTVAFTGSVSGGTTPYTYNFLVYNSVTGQQLANALYTGVSSTSSSFAWAFPSADVGNTVYANVIVTDSATSPSTVNSIHTATLTLDPGMYAFIHLTNTTLDIGQSTTLTATAYLPATTTPAGTSPYTYNFLVYNSLTGSLVFNALYTGVAAASNTSVLKPSISDVGGLTMNVLITDSASTPVVAVSSSLDAIVNTALSTPTISPTSSQQVEVGQTVIFNTYVTGGTSPYTYNFLVYNSVTNAEVANMLTTSNSFAYTIASAEAGSTLYANVLVTDSAYTPAAVNSVHSGVITVSASLSTPTISPTASSTQLAGNTVTFAAYVSGGTTPYTYNFLVYNSVTNSEVANMLTTSNSFAWTVPGTLYGNTVYANVLVTDAATIAAVTNSIHSGVLTIIRNSTYERFIQYTSQADFVAELSLNGSENITSPGSFTMATQVKTLNSALSANLFIYRRIGGIPYFLNGTIIGSNVLAPNYTTTYFKQNSYYFQPGIYVFTFNSLGNLNYSGFSETFVVNQTEPSSPSSSSGSSGGTSSSGGTTSSITSCGSGTVFNLTYDSCVAIKTVKSVAVAANYTPRVTYQPTFSTPGNNLAFAILAYIYEGQIPGTSAYWWWAGAAGSGLLTLLLYKRRSRRWTWALTLFVFIVGGWVFNTYFVPIIQGTLA